MRRKHPLAPNNGGTGEEQAHSFLTPPLLGAGGRFEVFANMRPIWRKAVRWGLAAVGAGVLVFALEILLAISGPDDHFQNPDRQPVRLGGPGKPLVYVVMGDSTAAGRGGYYAQGIAMQTARHLAQRGPVTLINLAVSGAKIRDVEQDQLPAALRLKPDIVLLAVGANDVTHFTPSRKITSGLSRILTQLAAARPGVWIVLTGSPDVGSARRFAQPLRWLAAVETGRVNRIMQGVQEEAAGRNASVVWAPIAQDTGPLFRRDPGLFAPDRFHPNDRGYAVWVPILNAALDQAR